MDLGLEFAGNKQIRFCAWVEKDDDCRRTLNLNHPHAEGKVFGDIRAVKPRQLMGAAGLDVGETFVLAGGPPCQAFSTAGLRQSVHEQRGQVVDHYFDLLRVIRPRFFVFENVRDSCLLQSSIDHIESASKAKDKIERLISMKNTVWDLFFSNSFCPASIG